MIVVAWWDEGAEVASAADCRIDLGERPKVTRVQVAKAATWRLLGSEADDVAKAQAAALRVGEGGTVFVYSDNEPDPLRRARAELGKTTKGDGR